jgi:hypothetical protein
MGFYLDAPLSPFSKDFEQTLTAWDVRTPITSRACEEKQKTAIIPHQSYFKEKFISFSLATSQQNNQRDRHMQILSATPGLSFLTFSLLVLWN